MSKRWTKEQDSTLIRLMSDNPLSIVSEKMGRSKYSCYMRYRRKGYTLTDRSETKMTQQDKILWGLKAKQRMIANDVSQRTVAEIYGCGYSFICNALNARRALTGETAMKIEVSIDKAIRRSILVGTTRRQTRIAAE